MKRSQRAAEGGFSLLELLMVLFIIGALASIALPDYMISRAKSLAVSCQSNRRHIEQDEAASYLANKAANLDIDPHYACPSGGTYVWLVSDPEDPDYPQVGCSFHFMGTDGLPATGSADSPEAPGEPTPAPEPESPRVTPGQALDDLMKSVLDLGLTGKVEKTLVDRLEQAKKHLEKGQLFPTEVMLWSFQTAVDKNQGQIGDEQAALLISKASAVRQLLWASP